MPRILFDRLPAVEEVLENRPGGSPNPVATHVEDMDRVSPLPHFELLFLVGSGEEQLAERNPKSLGNLVRAWRDRNVLRARNLARVIPGISSHDRRNLKPRKSRQLREPPQELHLRRRDAHFFMRLTKSGG